MIKVNFPGVHKNRAQEKLNKEYKQKSYYELTTWLHKLHYPALKPTICYMTAKKIAGLVGTIIEYTILAPFVIAGGAVVLALAIPFLLLSLTIAIPLAIHENMNDKRPDCYIDRNRCI